MKMKLIIIMKDTTYRHKKKKEKTDKKKKKTGAISEVATQAKQTKQATQTRRPPRQRDKKGRPCCVSNPSVKILTEVDP